MTKRRLTPKEQQFVEDYLAELNRAQLLPIFDKMSLSEVAKHVTSAMQGRTQKEEIEADVVAGRFVFPNHLIMAHAKRLTGKWFGWRITDGDYRLANDDLRRMYRPRRKASS